MCVSIKINLVGSYVVTLRARSKWIAGVRITTITTALFLLISLFMTGIASIATGTLYRVFYFHLAINQQGLNGKKQHQNTKYESG